MGRRFDLQDWIRCFWPCQSHERYVAQYAGRIHRESEGKTQVTIHDYVDCALPMLQRMFKKREKSYKAMGYALEYIDDNSNKQPSLKLETSLHQIPSQNKQQHFIKHFPMPLPPYAKTTIRLALDRNQTGN